MYKLVAVLMGGLSAENEVSKVSGAAVCKALEELGYKYLTIDPDKHLASKLAEIKPDVVFNALHGTYGEDGSIPGLLEVMQIPYTHSGVMASSIAMNKNMTRQIMQQNGIRVPDGGMYNMNDVRKALQSRHYIIKLPFVIKPVQQGSSVGVHVCHNEADVKRTISAISEDEWIFGEECILERFIPGHDVSTAVVAGKALGTLELVPTVEFYNYEAKYTDGLTKHIYPAPLPEAISNEAKRFAEKAHNLLGCRTISRSDMRYDDKEEKLYFLEINTHPGFTPVSILPEIAQNNGISFKHIVKMLLDDAICDIT